MTNPTQPQPAPQDLDEASLDLVVGAGGVILERDLRKQEQNDKLGPVEA